MCYLFAKITHLVVPKEIVVVVVGGGEKVRKLGESIRIHRGSAGGITEKVTPPRLASKITIINLIVICKTQKHHRELFEDSQTRR